MNEVKFNLKLYGFITDSYTKVLKNGKKSKSHAYNAWTNMVKRCYDKNNESYKYYGAKGVTICEEWKLFSNFKKWFDENYPNDGEKYHVDKDVLCEKLGIYPKVYSPETCVFLTKEENSKEAISRRDNTYLIGSTNPNAKTKDYYSKSPTSRSNFKVTCKKMSWSFLNFHEDFFGDITESGNKKFIYTEIKNNEKRRFVKNELLNGIYSKIAHSVEFYEENHTTRGNFKESCFNKGWNFEDFMEIYSGHKNAYNKRFFYIHKDKIDNFIITPNSDVPEKDGYTVYFE